MARSPAVNQGVVLPQPLEKYDVNNERETRRLLEEALRRLSDWGTVTSVPAPVAALSAVTGTVDTVPFFDTISTMALAALTPYARTIIACANAAAARTVLGLGSLAVLNTVTEGNITLADVITRDVSSTQHGFAPKAPGDATKFLNGAATPAFALVKGSDLSMADVTTNDVSSTKHGFTPKSPGDATKFLNGAATPAFVQVNGSDLAMTDVTANNVSTTKHGFAPKGTGTGTKYLDDTGAYSTPSGLTSLPSFPTISNWELGLDAALSVSTMTDGRVTQITDISGNARNATNGTTAGRVRYLKNGFNFKYPCWVFDGTNVQHMIVTIPNLVAPLTVVLVLQDLAVGNADGNIYRDQLSRGVGYLSTGGGQWQIFGTSAGMGSANLWTQNKEALPASMIGAPCVRIDIFNNASSMICNNNTEVTGTATSSGTLFGGTLNIGNGATAVTTAAKFLLRGFHIYSKALSLAERDSLRAYYADAAVAGIQL